MNVKLFFLFLFLAFVSGAQNQYYMKPLQIQIQPEQTFAEIENGRFHPGVNLSTLGTAGARVMAVADGYVSRIVVSPDGLGKALYITHDNGTTSVYGYLREFKPDIENYVKNFQYENKSFQADIALAPEMFAVKKYQGIALSGNSGDAEKAGLHFRLLNTATGDFLNPLVLALNVPDKQTPKILALQIVPLSENSHVNYGREKVIFETIYEDGKYVLKNNPEIQLFGAVGFAIEVTDGFDGAKKDMQGGMTSFELTIDDEIYSVFNINRIKQNQIKSINGWIDFDEYALSNRVFAKTWAPACNPLHNFEFTENRGILNVNLNKKYPVKIKVKDARGNSTLLEFTVNGRYRELPAVKNEATSVFNCTHLNKYETEDFRIEVPANALFDDIEFKYEKTSQAPEYYSPIHKVKLPLSVFNDKAKISLKCNELPPAEKNKVLVVKINPATGKVVPVGGVLENGWISAETEGPGSFAVAADNTPPSIVPHSIENNEKLTDTNQLLFTVNDDLSGIAGITATFDGQWALFEYDAGAKTIRHKFDASRFEMNKKHLLTLTVTDYKGNSTVYEATFHR